MNIKENCKILKLSYIFKNYEEEIKEAKCRFTHINI